MWRAGCGESRTSGSEGGPEKPTSRKAGRALRPDPYTYLLSSVRGRFFYLYLVEDVWSRRIVGFKVHEEESMNASAALVRATCSAEGVDPRGLVLHSDNGGPMRGSTMLTTLRHLGIVPSFSRPSVSDDNPFIESFFRTLKYRPGYPTSLSKRSTTRARG